MNIEDRLADLLVTWEEARQRGDDTNFDSLCRNCPELRDPFQRMLHALNLLDGAVPWVGDERSASVSISLPARVGRYRLMRVIGEGGLGTVFRAEDHELRREVAVKRIRGDKARNLEHQKRFSYEAEITSRLDHPGVVPMFGFGHDDDGAPFYAMRLIKGRSLDDAITALHQNLGPAGDLSRHNPELRGLLRSFMGVCETLAYSHSRGVLHRDIKPQNIMLGAYGETLVVDWGLAMPLKGVPVIAEASEATYLSTDSPELKSLFHSGVGTWAYMSPEQAAGQADELAAASDIFSLGATLWKLLVGQSRIAGRPEAEAKRIVRQGEFISPSAVRPNVPRPLVAICAKAMATRPADRYESAQDLAADLEKWLADEPVSCWQEPLAVRAGRWIKRRRTLVTSSVAVLSVASVLLAFFSVHLGYKNGELAQAYRKLQETNDALVAANGKEQAARLALVESVKTEQAARREAEKNLQRSIQHLFETHVFLYDSPQLQPLSTDPLFVIFVDHLFWQVERFAAEAPPNAYGESLLQLKETVRLNRVATQQVKGLPSSLAGQLKISRDYFQQRLADDPKDNWAAWGLARAHAEQARRLAEVPFPKEAAGKYVAAWEMFESHTDLDRPMGLECSLGAAQTAVHLANLHVASGRLEVDADLARLDRGLALLRRINSDASDERTRARTKPDAFRLAFLEMDVLIAKSTLLCDYKHDYPLAVASLQLALEASARCPREHADNPILVEAKVRCLGVLGFAQAELKNYAEAWTAFERAHESIVRLNKSLADKLKAKPLESELEWNLARVGHLYLQSFDRGVTRDKWKMGQVYSKTLRAIEHFQKEQLALPDAERNMVRVNDTFRWQVELAPYQNELKLESDVQGTFDEIRRDLRSLFK